MKDQTEAGGAAGARITDIGPHRVAVGDVTQGAVAVVMAGEKADVIYSDPPWGEGNLRYWRTHANDPAQPTWEPFVEAWTRAAAEALRPGGGIFVEMGLRWEGGFAEALAGVGLPVRYRWETQYRGGSKLLPVALLYSGPELRGDFNPAPLRGPALPRACVEAAARVLGLFDRPVPRGLVLDPCCGKGYTARAAVAAGMRFRGNELNPKRAAVTVAWLESHPWKA